MSTSGTMDIAGRSCGWVDFPTTKSRLLAICGSKGMLGCGYFDLATADKLGDALAVVRGVSSIEEVLEAPVQDVSRAGQSLGIAAGMTGREAMERLA